ncbi:MAG: polysaccharide deacetylase family protein [Deltaproteobacteria bacterium]|nr:polysaccharide deacetylase family protein [Deltaproteobacteria bacterium]
MNKKSKEYRNALLKYCASFAYSSFLHYSGLLDKIYRENITKGDLPYRILNYQHVANPTELPFPIMPDSWISPVAFEKQMRYLKRNTHLISLSELLENLKEEKPLPPATTVVTFSPGHKDFYTQALPIIKDYRIPCTLFVPTSFIGTNNSLWSDKVLLTCRIMQHLSIPFPELPFIDEKFYLLTRTKKNAVKIHEDFPFLLVLYLQILPSQQCYLNLLHLFSYFAEKNSLPVYSYFLSWEELQNIAKQKIEIASCGDNYKLFNFTSAEELLADIMLSVKTLFDHGIEPISCVMASDKEPLSQSIRRALKEAGISEVLNPYCQKDILDKNTFALEHKTIIINQALAYIPILLTTIWKIKLFKAKIK